MCHYCEGAEAYLSAYVVNMEYSAFIGAGLSFAVYTLLSVLATPGSLKIARAEAAAMTEEEKRAMTTASEAAAPAAPAAAPPAAPAAAPPAAPAAAAPAAARPVVKEAAELYVDSATAVAAASTAAVASTDSSASSETTVVTSETSETSEDSEIITTTVVTKTVVQKKNDNAYVQEAGLSKGKKLPPPPDVDDLDLNAVKRFYEECTARVRDALAPARAAQEEAEDAIAALAAERRAMLDGHAASKAGGKSGSMTMAEVRYETMQMNLLIAEAELASANVADELAEAWTYFEAEGGQDCAAIEARLEKERESREKSKLVQALYALVAARQLRANDAAAAAADAAAAARDAASAVRDAEKSAARATGELRAEDESRSFLRNWALAVGTWMLPPILDVPMLPMNEAEARVRAQEDARRVEYEFSSRASAEEEQRRRADEDSRRAAAEADLRRMSEDEERLVASEDARRRAAVDDVDRLRSMVVSSSETIEVTKTTITKQSATRVSEEKDVVEREETRRAAAKLEIERLEIDVAQSVDCEETRRLEFDEVLKAMAAEEEARRTDELACRVTFDAETTRLETEETTRRTEDNTLLSAARLQIDASRTALVAVVDDIEVGLCKFNSAAP